MGRKRVPDRTQRLSMNQLQWRFNTLLKRGKEQLNTVNGKNILIFEIVISCKPFISLNLNCEHVLFVYILKQRRKKFRRFLEKYSRIFKNLNFLQIKNL